MSPSAGASSKSQAKVSGSHAQHGYHFLKEFLVRPTRIGAVAPAAGTSSVPVVPGRRPMD